MLENNLSEKKTNDLNLKNKDILEDEGFSDLEKVADDVVPPTLLKEDVLDEQDLLLEETESLSNEEDRHFFWLLRKILGLFFKILLLGGAVFFFLWFVWFSDKTPASKIKISPLITSPKKQSFIPSGTITKIPPSQAVIFASETLLWSQEIEKYRQNNIQDSLSRSLLWIRKARAFFDVPLNNIDWGEGAIERSHSVQKYLLLLRGTINESAALRSILANEMHYLSQKTNFDSQRAQQYDGQLANALASLSPEQTQEILRQKILVQKSIPESSSKYSVYRTIIQSMEVYDRSLRAIYENVYANQHALIENVQVVHFPNDPLERVLTPSEWRSLEDKK